MKIALLSPSIYMSPTHYKDMIFAPRDLAVHLADGLVDKGHEVYFFTAPDVPSKATIMGGDSDLLTRPYEEAMLAGRSSERLKWGYFYRKKQLYELSLTQYCYAVAQKEGIDIVHSYIDTSAHFLEELTGIPTVYTLHDPLPTTTDDLSYWLFKRYEKHLYVSISNAFRRSEILAMNFVDTVYHGIDISVDSEPSEEAYIAFTGRLIREKGAHTAIDVAKELRVPIHLASSTEKANISDNTYFKTMIEPKIDPSLVTFFPFMDDREKHLFYRHAKCFLFPIEWEEPFGMVMIEAMAQGTPVIAYNRGSVSELVVDGVTGFIVDPDNHDRPGKGSWTIKTQGQAGLIEAFHRLGEIDRKACKSHVAEHFSIEQMVEGYIRLYEKVLHNQ